MAGPPDVSRGRAASPLAERIGQRLEELRSRGLSRVMRPPAGIDLSSNDSLNLATDPRVRAGFIAGIERDGCGSTGSRLLRGDREAFVALEARFARFKRAERALFLSSGFLANLAVLTGLTETGDVIFSDQRNHASLIDGIRLSPVQALVCPHNDLDHLAELISTTPCDGVRFVVVESLYSMDGDYADLAGYAALCERTGATLVVDEAHAVGIYGDRGSGLLEAAGLDVNACVSINPAGKALGVGGAFVAGPASVVEYLVQRARPFVFSTAAPPAMAEALQISLDIIEAEPDRRARLKDRAGYLRARLHAAGLDVARGHSHIVPVVIGDNDRAVVVAASLQAEGFDVRAIRPPSVAPGTARLRISVNAALSEASLDRFADLLAATLRAGGCRPAGSDRTSRS